MHDKHIGQSHFVLQLHHHIQEQRQNANIQCRYRLITDDKLRVDCKSTRHADSLAAAAIQLVRICIDKALCQADCIDLIRQLVISKGDCILWIISRYAGISLCLVIIATIKIIAVIMDKVPVLRCKVPLRPFRRGFSTFAVLTFVRKVCIFRPRIEDDAVIAAGLVLPVYCLRCRRQ